MNWSTIEREAYTVLSSLKKIDRRIFGSQIQVVPDQKPTHILTKRTTHMVQKLARWPALQRYVYGLYIPRRATSPVMWLVEGEERWEAPGHTQGFLPLNWSGTEQKRGTALKGWGGVKKEKRKKVNDMAGGARKTINNRAERESYSEDDKRGGRSKLAKERMDGDFARIYESSAN
ncbi:hypothetical protein TNCV_4588241 [Trichonephila clavipes]|nr:hypothetical protein TNCV_4588241 [Trichonephila clavipes]